MPTSGEADDGFGKDYAGGCDGSEDGMDRDGL